MNANFSWEYDVLTRHYVIRNARLLFVNFAGAERNYNQKGRRNFKVEIPDDLANEMERQGIYVGRKMRPLDDGTEELQNTIKVSVYPDAKIALLNNGNMANIAIDNDDPDNDGGPMVDREFSKGHVVNGEIDLEIHISRNNKVANSSPYLRVDLLYIPIRRSKLEEEYERYGRGDED